MNQNILKPVVQEYIDAHYKSDTFKILLQKQLFEGIGQKELVDQLIAKRKCQNKLPTWFKTPNIVYPKPLNIEQCSSEITANYKSALVGGKCMWDLTGGFGVDTFYFTKHFDQVTHVEMDPWLSEVANHNFQQLQVENIDCRVGDGIETFLKTGNSVDLLYIDPARRGQDQSKKHLLIDYSPNILGHLDQLLERTQNLMVKTSPLLDISKGLEELRFVKEVHAIAVENEVKELLWILGKDTLNEVIIRAVNIEKGNQQSFEIKRSEETESGSSIGPVDEYLYLPNAAILKSGAFKSVGARFNLTKLHEHTHLYSSDELIEFPGKRYRVLEVADYTKKLPYQQGNVATRNFPLKAHEIIKKHKIKPGGDRFLFFITDHKNQKVVIDCKRV